MSKRTKTTKHSDSPFPLKPMLATRIEEPFNHSDWIYEVKLDGYRIISQVINNQASLLSRGQLNYTDKYPEAAEALSQINYNAVFDGEVIVIGKDSKPSFNLLLHYRKGYNIKYYIFDILWYNGINLMKKPLKERRELLKQNFPESDILKLSEDFEDGISLFNRIKEMGGEGIVAKKKDSIYIPGRRVQSWLKIPVTLHKDYVIGGWAESDSGKLFRSLLFGNYDNGSLVYVHHAGGGFDDKTMNYLLNKLKKIEIDEKPFANKVDDIETKIHWVKPQLVGEFKISNKKSPSGKIRHPAIFIRLRDDKKPVEVGPEVIAHKPLEPVHDTPAKKNKSESAIINSSTVKINGHQLTLTNLDHKVWHDVLKADLFQFYHNIWDYISPYLKDRPLGLHSNPYGAKGPDKWIRNIGNNYPEWIEVFKTKRKHKKPGKGDYITWLLCSSEAALFYIVNLDCIDLHPWSSRTVSMNYPDYLVIDLDPSDNDFSKVIETAKAAKEIFDKHKIKAFPKTSGKTGMHLLIPVNNIPFGTSRTIAENIASEIRKLVPEITTLSVSVNQRKDRLYIDPNQNDYSDRIAAPYSLRTADKPLVSTPLSWREINSTLDPYNFTIHTIFKRLEKKGDLFEGLFSAINRKHNAKILKNLV